jgi:hypothetical protein
MSAFKVGDRVRRVRDLKGLVKSVPVDAEFTVETVGKNDMGSYSAGEGAWLGVYDFDLELVGDSTTTTTAEPTHDRVNHPSHYVSDPSGIECIQITRHRNFNIGNAIKYLWRAGLKTSTADKLTKRIEDLEKARWYIADEIERLKGVPSE